MKVLPTVVTILQGVLVLVVAWLIVDAVKQKRAKKAAKQQQNPPVQEGPEEEPVVEQG